MQYNTAILVDKTGSIVGKYRKIHVPGHFEHEPWRQFQHLEKRYFTPGKSFDVYQAFGGTMGMALCNDRRWAELPCDGVAGRGDDLHRLQHARAQRAGAAA
jgi:predicted amidohydrolase